MGEPGKKEREEREHLDSFAFLQCMEFKNRAQEAVSRIFSRIIRLMTEMHSIVKYLIVYIT